MTLDFKGLERAILSEERIADDPAIDQLRTVVRVRRHLNAGIKFGADNLFAKATTAFDEALKLSPMCAEAWMCRGLALEQMRQFDLAYDSYAQAAVLTPHYDEARERIAVLGPPLGRPAAVLTPWIENPPSRRVAVAMQKLKKRLGWRLRRPTEPERGDRTEEDLRRDLVQTPSSAIGAIMLARHLRRSGRYLEAQYFLRYALKLKPWSGDAANLLCELAEDGAAREIARAAFDAGSTDPRLPYQALWDLRKVCDWTEEHYWREKTLESLRIAPMVIPALATLTIYDDPALQHASAVGVTQWQTGKHKQLKHAGRRSADGPITIGYLSADFREHPVARLIAEVLELHDRQRFRVFGYGVFNGRESDIGRRVRAAFDKFTDLFGVKPEDAAKRIANDGVDILIDLTGHTEHSTIQIVAYKPAPVVVNFLGYPGTLGSTAIDYIIVDHTIVPPAQQPWFTESLVFMPDCYQPNDRKRALGKPNARTEYGLPAQGVVYCSFNEAKKITPELFDVWMRVLSRVPGSVLWLSVRRDAIVANLRARAKAAGVDPARLVIAAPLPKHEDHMARYVVSDFFLDTVIYNGHTTTSDALWGGCPGVALLGNTYPTRVAASLLRTMGLPELIVDSLSAYEELAVRAGLDEDWRKALRAKVEAAKASSPLFDTPRFTQHLERAYQAMWSAFVQGRAAASFEVQAIDDGRGDQ